MGALGEGGAGLGDGQSQQQRLLPALDPSSAPVDGRDLQQWLDFAAEMGWEKAGTFSPPVNL